MLDIDSMPIGLAVIALEAADGPILVKANRRLWDGADREAAAAGVGCSALCLVAPEDRSSLSECLDATVAGEAWHDAFRIRTETDDRRWIDWRAQPDSDREFGRILVVAVADITETVEVGATLKERDERLLSFAQSMPGALFSYVVPADGPHRIDFMSSGSTRIWEIPPHRAVADPTLLWSQVVPEDVERMAESIRLSAETGEDWTIVYGIETPSGQRKFLEGRGRPHRRPDGSICWYSVVLDVSDRIFAAREVERALSEASAHSQAKSAFLSHMSHEIRTPLNAILGYGQMLQLGIGLPAAGLPAQAAGYVDRILGSAKHLDDIIRQLFDVSLIESNSLILEEETVDLSSVLSQAAAIVSGSTSAFTVAFEGAEIGEGFALLADKARLLQVFINIFKNAQKYARVDAVAVDLRLSDETVRIGVTDTGRGFPDRILAHADEPFVQARRSEYTAGGGLGVGLYISRRIIDAHGGRLDLSNGAAGGARVDIFLPTDRIAGTEPSSGVAAAHGR